MAGFSGYSFTYDGIPSEKYNLYLFYISASDIAQTNEKYSPRLMTLPQSYNKVLSGYEPSDPLSFEIYVTSEEPIDAHKRRQINKWLMGRNEFKEFRVHQPDLLSVSYRCIFTEQETVYIGNNHYLRLVAYCDSQYQYGTPQIINKNVNGLIEFDYYNKSDVYDYIYPTVEITMGSSGGNVTITNHTDNDRVFQFTGLSGSEVLNIDNKNKIIKSSTLIYRLSNFNKKWFRFKDGLNSLSMNGNFDVVIKSPLLKRVGA